MPASPVVSFDEFAAAHTARLLGLAHALTGNPHDAWDLTQETLARVCERWRRVHGDPSAYARTIMVRLNIDRIRRWRREVPRPWDEDGAAAGPTPDEGVDAWLVDALATLTPRQRTALALRARGGPGRRRHRRPDGLLDRHRQEPPVARH